MVSLTFPNRNINELTPEDKQAFLVYLDMHKQFIVDTIEKAKQGKVTIFQMFVENETQDIDVLGLSKASIPTGVRKFCLRFKNDA